MRRSVRRRGRDRLRPPRHGARRALRRGARPAAAAMVHAAPAAAGLFRARCRSARAGEGRGGTRAVDRRIREAEILRVQAVDLRAQPLAEDRLHAMHRRVLDAGDSRRRRPCRRRAAPVHGLRRVHDRLPVRRADLRVSHRRRSRSADAHAARHVRAGRRTRCRPAPACRRCAAGPRVARAPRSRAAGADAAARGPAHRVGRHRFVDGRAGVGRLQRRRPRHGPRSAAIPRCAAIPDVDRADDRERAGLPGRAFPPDRRERAKTLGRALAEWQVALPPRIAATFAATNDKRRTLAFAFDHLALHAPVPPNDDSAAGGRAVRIASTWTATAARCASRASASCPEAALLDHAETPQAAVHREQLRAMRPLRQDVPRAGDHARAAARPDARRARAARAERGGRFSPARAAASRWAPKSSCWRWWSVCAATRCSPARTASRGCGCAPIAASST